MKITSIALLVVVIVMNMFSWVSFGTDLYGGYGVKQMLGMYQYEIFSDEGEDALQDQLDYVGINLDADDILDNMHSIIDPLMDLGISPFDFISMTMGFNGLIELMSDPDIGWVMGMDLMNPDDMMVVNLIQGVLTLGSTLYVITVVVAVLHIILHALNKKGLGISVPIITFLNILFMAFIWLIAMAATSGVSSGAIMTLAPFVSLACGIVSCVFWGKARKYINMVMVEPQPQQVYVNAPVQPVTPAPYGQVPVQPVPQVPVQPVAPAPQVQPAKKFCVKCGAELDVNAKFCDKCGNAQ